MNLQLLDKLITTQELKWSNYIAPIGKIEKIIPPGTTLILQTEKPEGFGAKTENGEDFFIFRKDFDKIQKK